MKPHTNGTTGPPGVRDYMIPCRASMMMAGIFHELQKARIKNNVFFSALKSKK